MKSKLQFKKKNLKWAAHHWWCRNEWEECRCSYNEETCVIQTVEGWRSFDLAFWRVSLKPHLRFVYDLSIPSKSFSNNLFPSTSMRPLSSHFVHVPQSSRLIYVFRWHVTIIALTTVITKFTVLTIVNYFLQSSITIFKMIASHRNSSLKNNKF